MAWPLLAVTSCRFVAPEDTAAEGKGASEAAQTRLSCVLVSSDIVPLCLAQMNTGTGGELSFLLPITVTHVASSHTSPPPHPPPSAAQDERRPRDAAHRLAWEANESAAAHDGQQTRARAYHGPHRYTAGCERSSGDPSRRRLCRTFRIGGHQSGHRRAVDRRAHRRDGDEDTGTQQPPSWLPIRRRRNAVLLAI